MRFTAPNGAEVSLTIRPDTNDENVCRSILAEDEYRLDAIKPLTGTAVDVGAHIGAATVALCELNPELHVVAIEPVPENLELLRENTARYGDRVTIIAGAAGKGPQTIRYGFAGHETGRVHRFIGNQHMPGGTPYSEIVAPGVTLTQLVERFGPIALLKIDCEGCEHAFLDDPAIDQVERIHGEYHDGPDVEVRFDKPCRKRARRKAAAK